MVTFLKRYLQYILYEIIDTGAFWRPLSNTIVGKIAFSTIS